MRDANRYDHNWYQNEMEQCENGDYVHYTDYATLRTRHAALVEAVKNLRDSQMTLMRVTREHYTPKENMEYDCALKKYRTSRAEVDRLIGEGEG